MNDAPLGSVSDYFLAGVRYPEVSYLFKNPY